MKEYIKLFDIPSSANNHLIDDPFLCTIESTGQNITCDEPDKKLVVNGDTVEVTDAGPTVIEFTVEWNHERPGDGENISLLTEHADEGMTISQFIDSNVYNPADEYGERKYRHNSSWYWGLTYGFSDESVIITSGSTQRYNDYFTCLLGDTEVTMADGSRKFIKDIQLGDKVLSLDLASGSEVIREVIYTDADQNKRADVWDEWEFDNGTIIKTTYRHEFYNVEAGAFKYLDEWEIGQHTYSADGTTPALIKHAVHHETVNHYKITLEGSNNYFANGLLTGDRYCNNEQINIKSLYRHG